MEIENTRLSGLTNLYERENKKLKDQKEKIIKDAKEQADKFLKEINSRFESTIKNIRESNAAKESIKEEKKELTKIKEKVTETLKIDDDANLEETEFKTGDYVQIKDSLTIGQITEIDHYKKNVTLESGSLKIRAKLKNLIHAKKPKQEQISYLYSQSSSLDSTTLDIRGKKPEEIEFDLIKFIDDAHLSGVKNVEIVHGKGTGVLRETVQQLLKNHELVENYELASVEFGGAGATNVKLK